MMYLIGEISIYLLLAVSIGFLTGWFSMRRKKNTEMVQVEQVWKANLYSLQEELDRLRAAEESADPPENPDRVETTS